MTYGTLQQPTSYIAVLFDLLVIFTQATLIDFSFLEDFYKEKVSKTYAIKHRFEIVRYFLASCTL